ncbi:MAG: PQQ-binding-like beta-propeller repeat protein [Planctomycetales bacterium]
MSRFPAGIRMSSLVALSLLALSTSSRGDDWPQWGGPRRDLVWRETGLVDKFPKNSEGFLPRVWSAPIGEGYAGPAVAEGKVFVMDRLARERTERVLCLDAGIGKLLWKHEYPAEYTISYPAGPRCTPTVDGDRVYAVGAMGHLFCLNAADGKVLWRKDYVADFDAKIPVWGVSSAPLVDGRQLIALVGGANNALVVAFDKLTGEELWRSLDDPDVGYCPPVIFEYGGVRQLIVWHPRAVTAIDPANGAPLWSIPYKVQAGMTIATPRQVGDRLFVSSFYNGPRMIDVNGRDAALAWKKDAGNEIDTDGLHSLMCTPWVTESHIYGIDSYGQLRCLDAQTGERLWETVAPTGRDRWWNAFLVPQGDRFFIHNEQGDLIIAKLSPAGYEELDRAKLLEPTRPVRRRQTIWSHPAFAMKSVFARNDKEIVRVDLSAGK